MEALPTCSDAANSPRYGPITSGDFMRGWYAGEYTSMRTLTPAQVQVVETDPGGLHGFPAVCLPQVFRRLGTFLLPWAARRRLCSVV